jgi:hypothetical protein
MYRNMDWLGLRGDKSWLFHAHNYLKNSFRGLNALFGLEYARYGEEHKEIFETETSERSFEEETKLSGFSAAPVKAEGNAISYDNAQEAWTARYTTRNHRSGFLADRRGHRRQPV